MTPTNHTHSQFVTYDIYLLPGMTDALPLFRGDPSPGYGVIFVVSVGYSHIILQFIGSDCALFNKLVHSLTSSKSSPRDL